MLVIVDQLVNMRPKPGGSLHDIHIEAAHRIEQLHGSLRKMQEIALQYVEAGGPEDAAVEEAQRALVDLGDPDAVKGDREFADWKRVLGLVPAGAR